MKTENNFNGVAAVLSFLVPGLGQIYTGRVAIGFLFLFGTLLGLIMGILPGVVLWIIATVHAGKPPKQPINEQRVRRIRRGASTRDRLIRERREPVDGPLSRQRGEWVEIHEIPEDLLQ